MKKIIFALGGTGGHVFPAIALAEAWSQNKEVEIVFAGSNLPSNPYFQHSKLTGYHIPSPSLNKKNLFTFPFLFVSGFFKSLQFLKRESPTALLGFGSYHTASLMLAAFFLRIPYTLFESNAYPGMVNRYSSYFSKKNFITFEDAASFLHSPSTLVSPPIRKMLKENTLSQKKCREALGLDPSLFTLLIFGGSQGALALNEAVIEALILLKKNCSFPFQVYHITGSEAEKEKASSLFETLSLQGKVVVFEKRMDLAWKSASLALTRGGALTLFEAIETKTPLVIVPLPSAKEDHQTKNGMYFTTLFPFCSLLPQDTNLSTRIFETLLNFFSLPSENYEDMKNQYCYFVKHNASCPLEDKLPEILNL